MTSPSHPRGSAPAGSPTRSLAGPLRPAPFARANSHARLRPATRRRVVLYNPKTVFWTMPLALVAIGSAVDPKRYEVVIVDGRFERDPVAAVLQAVDDPTVCLGLTV